MTVEKLMAQVFLAMGLELASLEFMTCLIRITDKSLLRRTSEGQRVSIKNILMYAILYMHMIS